MKTRMALVLVALLAVPASAAAQQFFWEYILDGPLTEYGQRKDSVTLGLGNAKAANAAIHTINPRPPGSRNRSIPASGERMSRAIRRYQDVSKLPEAARPIAAESGVSGTGAGGTAGGGSSGSSSSGK
jgi:hypothetical protein